MPDQSELGCSVYGFQKGEDRMSDGRKDRRFRDRRGGRDRWASRWMPCRGDRTSIGGTTAGGFTSSPLGCATCDCRWAGGCGWWCGDGVVGVAQLRGCLHTKKLLMGSRSWLKPRILQPFPHQNPVDFSTLTPLAVKTTKTGRCATESGGTTRADHHGTVCREGAAAELQTGDDGFIPGQHSAGVTSLLQHRLPD